MFTFLEDESDLTFKEKVTINHPKSGKQEFKAEFLMLEQEQINDLIKDDVEFLKKVFVGFEGVRDADKQTIEFSEQVRDAMLQRPYVRNALVVTYTNTIGGARRGN